MPKKQKNVQKFTKHILLLYLKVRECCYRDRKPKINFSGKFWTNT